VIPQDLLRRLTLTLGVGTVVFGVAPFLFPRQFARLFGIDSAGPAGDFLVRAVGARDAISGIGILSAVMHGGRVGPWLLGRGLSDGTDILGVTIAWLSGARNPRLLMLGTLAVSATALDTLLYVEHKRVAREASATGD
jgi:hypothetical protein